MYDLNYSAPEARELYWPAADPEQPESGHSGGLCSDSAGGTCCHHQRGVFLGVRVTDPMDTLGDPDRIVSGSTYNTAADPTFSTTLN